MNKIVKDGLEEYNTTAIDMGHIGNQPLQNIYYDSENLLLPMLILIFLKIF